jgi:hypothetical protein
MSDWSVIKNDAEIALYSRYEDAVLFARATGGRLMNMWKCGCVFDAISLSSYEKLPLSREQIDLKKTTSCVGHGPKRIPPGKGRILIDGEPCGVIVNCEIE